jgi:hypothetical protein
VKRTQGHAALSVPGGCAHQECCQLGCLWTINATKEKSAGRRGGEPTPLIARLISSKPVFSARHQGCQQQLNDAREVFKSLSISPEDSNLYEVLVHGNAPVKSPIRAERDRPLNRPSGAGFRIEFKSVPRR